ncbi:malonyl-ACP O-methyltransferase BioC [bacterium]|nr:malonyl-ACP O-methyltransferase BioC [bacterium]
MPTDYKSVKKQFEKSMNEYDDNALVQNIVALKMICEVAQISINFENILELGSGTGLTTKKIAREFKFKNFFANDLVEKSKIYVQKYIPNANFLCGNALKIKPPKKMDLVISNAMFQWFDNLESAVGTIKKSMNKGAILAFSTFGVDNYKELRDITGLSLNYKTLGEIKNILEKLGFKILYGENFYEEMSFKSPLELLVHMKKTGVNSLSDEVWTFKKVKDFCDKFSKKYPKTILTYSPIIVVARKK